MDGKNALRITALLLVIPLLLIGCGLLPAQYDDSFQAALSDKLQLLAAAQDQPRIILIGGSAAAFGVDTAQVQQALPQYSVIHFGLYAGFGLPMMLELARDHLREGDLVLVMPEQQQQSLTDYFNAELVWQAADGDFSWLPHLDSRHCPALAAAFPSFAVSKLRYVLSGVKPLPDAVYARASFDADGNLRSSLTNANCMPGGWDAGMPIDLTAASLPDESWLSVLTDFVNAAQARGADVRYLFCPMNADALTAASNPDDYYDMLCGLLPCPVLGDPNNSVLAAGWFYDTNFHLNAAGRTVYTVQLIRALKAELGITSATADPSTEMPPYAAAAMLAGDDRDADCFLYEDRDGKLVLTGLTGLGQQREKLLIPTQIEGKPVCALADGLFAESPALRCVILQWQAPGSCTAGQGLLDGAGDALRIYVPSGCGDTYKLNYFWSVYAARIMEEE